MKALNALSESFLENHPTQAALVLEGVEEKALALFFSRLAPRVAGKVFEHLDPEVAAECLRRMTPPKAASIAQELSAHARVVALRQMTEQRCESILSALEEQVAEQTRRMMRFADESVAAIMDTDVLTLRQDMRTGEAMRRIRQRRRNSQGELYVLDREHRLKGVTTLHALLKSPRDQFVSENMNTDCARVRATVPQDVLVFHPLWTHQNSVAVVDDDDLLLGVVDHRTVAKAGERLQMANRRDAGLETALALGELYWMGLTGMLDGLAKRIADTTTEEPDHGPGAEN